VQNPHDLKSGFVHAEKNHMFAFRRNLAAGKKILAKPEFRGIRDDGLEFFPDLIQIQLFLDRSPPVQGVGAD